MNVNSATIKAIATFASPFILDLIEKGVPPEKLYEIAFNKCTELGIHISDELNKSLGETLGENIETVLQGYIDALIDGTKNGLKNGLDKNELPNGDAV